MSLLLYTHVWVWWHLEPDRIPARAHKLIAAAGRESALYLSAISPWEVSVLVEKRRLELNMDVLAWIERALELPGLSVYPLTPAIAVASTRLPFPLHPDPADRIIAATALELGATLLTRDERLLECDGVRARWAR
ncbi:MAG: type II toxin-antitoxin system VapC family toxin [Deltaproteobacteria bacterium]|nr:type II toxin-antitoxin system VapC family toxin [Deltaproteobacteria bacterium]